MELTITERGQEAVDLNAWIVGYPEEHDVENLIFLRYSTTRTNLRTSIRLSRTRLRLHPNTMGHAIIPEAAIEKLPGISYIH